MITPHEKAQQIVSEYLRQLEEVKLGEDSIPGIDNNLRMAITTAIQEAGTFAAQCHQAKEKELQDRIKWLEYRIHHQRVQLNKHAQSIIWWKDKCDRAEQFLREVICG